MRLTADQHALFAAACDEHTTFVVTTHMNPDGDALGSQIAVARYLLTLDKQVRLINGDPTPDLLAFVTAESPQIEVYDPAVHDDVLRNVDRIILVDNSVPDRLGRMEAIMTSVADHTLCVDHHPTPGTLWAENILEPGACATAVLVWDLLRHRGWEPDLLTCQALFVGLATDTGFFRFNSAKGYAHRVAAELLDRGVLPGEIYRRVCERNSEAFTRLLGHALTGLELDAGGRVAAVRLSRETITDLGAQDVDTGEINTALLAIDGVDIALLFRELENGRVKVSLRSKGELDVRQLANGFGGGGHRNASGIVLSESMEAVVEQVMAGARDLLSA